MKSHATEALGQTQNVDIVVHMWRFVGHIVIL